MNSNMVKSEQFDHLHLVYQFIVPLRLYSWSNFLIKEYVYVLYTPYKFQKTLTNNNLIDRKK